MNNITNKIDNIRGTYDLLPEQSGLWESVESIITETVTGYGYSQIRTPIIEETALFKRSIGEVTDIVEKEMYTFSDRDKYSLTLRPEATASCVRACIQHNLCYGNTPKVWYMGPMFRHERPQKGRFRQFNQLGCEVFGIASADVDAELIAMTALLWKRLGIEQEVRLELNTLGQLTDRNQYKEQLIAYFETVRDQLDEDSVHRLYKNPLRILDSKNPDMKHIIEDAPQLMDHIAEDCREHFDALRERLDALGVQYTINPQLVRGLDYYNRSVFEWVTDSLGAQGTICAGGRYDSLVEQLGGDATPACGFAMGLERIIDLVKSLSQSVKAKASTDIYLVKNGPVDNYAWQLAGAIRDTYPSLRVAQHLGGGNFKKQMKKADKSGAELALIVGEAELAGQTVGIKFLRQDKQQQTVELDALNRCLAEVFNLN